MVEAEEDGDGGWRERGIEGKGIRVLVPRHASSGIPGTFLSTFLGEPVVEAHGCGGSGVRGCILGDRLSFARSDEWNHAFVGSCMYLISIVVLLYVLCFQAQVLTLLLAADYCWWLE
jgi:hypothetical protein